MSGVLLPPLSMSSKEMRWAVQQMGRGDEMGGDVFLCHSVMLVLVVMMPSLLDMAGMIA